MADTAPDAPEGESVIQKQARLRREKRQNKMAAEGEDRLARIKALNGGIAPPDEVLGGPAAPSGPKAASVEDPDEADIDTFSGTGTPQGRNMGANENPLMAAMFQQQQRQQQGQQGEEEDPMVRMMQQLTGMLGGNPQNPNDPNQQPAIPPWATALMSAGKSQEEQKAPVTGSAYLWRITHAVFAFTLALYIALESTFSGTKLARSQTVYHEDIGMGLGPRLFWIFATAELLLQSTRYFLEKGQLQGGGMLAMVANSGFVPEPYAQWVRTAGRYFVIFQTIVSDAMVIVFVFGALAWWNGKAAS